MAWVEKRTRWRLRDWATLASGKRKRTTLVSDLGIWKDPAFEALTDYKRAKQAGFVGIPKCPTFMADVRAFLKAKKDGTDSPNQHQPIPIDEMCALLIKHHGPSLKGGISDHWKSSFYIWRTRVGIINRTWSGKLSSDVNAHHVRDLLAKYKTVGTRMKYLRIISHMFSAFAEWNEQGILTRKVLLPAQNPGKLWRTKMKPSEKRELPDTRVLSESEWLNFSQFLSRRAFHICDIALRRFLRRSDIQNICAETLANGTLEGIQEKTGDRYSIPALSNQPVKYDFTNFEKEFHQAQVDAEMNHPVGHPLHFSLRTLRRTGATWAYRKTKDLVSISAMLGHRDIATTIRYLSITHADKALIAAAMDQMAVSKTA